MLIPIHVKELRSRFVYVEADNGDVAVDALKARFKSGKISLDESDVDGRDYAIYPASYAADVESDFVAYGNTPVGAQKFTHAELEKAWDTLKSLCNDKQIVYDIRNGYSVTERRDCNENQWHMPFDLESVRKELSAIDSEITFGDLEVYWNNAAANDADSEGHGIRIEDGKITEVY